jgi:hypothetical protein
LAHTLGEAGDDVPTRLPPLLTFERLVAECLVEYIARAGDAVETAAPSQ